MKSFVNVMASLRALLVTALKSLFRGKRIIQALLAFWITSAAIRRQSQQGEDDAVAGTTSEKADLSRKRDLKEFLEEADSVLLGPIRDGALQDLASKLKSQFRRGLRHELHCMLPSYNYQLPDGTERGRFLALDVGGSTLRVALVELRDAAVGGGGMAENEDRRESHIVRMDSFTISQDVKRLKGLQFFDWMAGRIAATVLGNVGKDSTDGFDKALPMGLAWSFPIEQTSLKGGKLNSMGKGFLAAEGLLGQDLGAIVETACAKQGVPVEVAAIVNDSTATLLAQAFHKPSTRFGLILGTGVNIAAHLPVSTLGRAKFGARPAVWFDRASHVVVNTELGMFGRDGVLPLTRWDKLLAAGHPRPDFQPFEYLVSGYYLGEICRLALLEAVEAVGLLGGIAPPSLLQPYSLSTETLSIVQSYVILELLKTVLDHTAHTAHFRDTSPSLEKSRAIFHTLHPSPTAPPAAADMAFLRTLASLIARRSAALVAASLFALWELKAEAETELTQDPSGVKTNSSPGSTLHTNAARAELALARSRTHVAFNGSVIERYPGYRAHCQQYVDHLVASSRFGAGSAAIELVLATESSLLGAAVALACLGEHGQL